MDCECGPAAAGGEDGPLGACRRADCGLHPGQRGAADAAPAVAAVAGAAAAAAAAVPAAPAAAAAAPPNDYIKINKIEGKNNYDEIDLLLNIAETHPKELKNIRYITKEELKATSECEYVKTAPKIDDNNTFYSLIEDKRKELKNIVDYKEQLDLDDEVDYTIEFNKLLNIENGKELTDIYPKNEKEDKYISYKDIYDLKNDKIKKIRKNEYIKTLKQLIDHNTDIKSKLLKQSGGNYPIYKYTKPNFNNYEVNNIIDLFNLVKVDNIFNNKKDNEKLIYDAKILLDNNFNKFENLNPINENILDIRENIDDVYGIIINSYKKQQLIKELIDKKNKLSDEFEDNCKLLIEYSEI
mgnify:CR=1 FL=1